MSIKNTQSFQFNICIIRRKFEFGHHFRLKVPFIANNVQGRGNIPEENNPEIQRIKIRCYMMRD